MADSSSSSHSLSPSSSPSSSSVRRIIHSALQLFCWKQPKTSAAAFGVSLTVLVSLSKVSIISVVSYLLLTCLCVTITFRVYKAVIQAVQKSEEGHPFKSLLDRDISVSSETVRPLIDQGLIHVNWFICQTRRLLLVEDVVDSVKLAVVMWLMTYIGAVFNGLSLLILADVVLFMSPLIYQKKKSQIDELIKSVRSRFEETLMKLQNRLPGAVKRTKTG
ncbi:reticulon-3-B-like isoform X3 [Cynoglossus semilaevis]|uniref:reticulon-3-B-like isoform X3 n=1 Tax=Cynoglossus semilaevis TaxID=244447 RepID=UPI000497EF55|nr:reticulon-3-B-like isoform X3 [Cynoglossus semilaevis]